MQKWEQSLKLLFLIDFMERLIGELNKYAKPEKAKIYQCFFKTGPGQYGEGDVFVGVSVPESRAIAKKFLDIGFDEIRKHLQSAIHEERLIGLLILIEKFKKCGDDSEDERKKIFDFYLENRGGINNWDLVDLSADKIVGEFLLEKNKDLLYDFAKSADLWDRRISVLATFAFIKKNEFDEALKIYKELLEDKHDLIHKAVGWMLREIGKRDLASEESFLKKYYQKMPRTMLRYAIEKFEEGKRQQYLKGKI